VLALEADTAAYSGRLKDAREFPRRTMDSAERSTAAGETRGSLLSDSFGATTSNHRRLRVWQTVVTSYQDLACR